MKKIYYFFLVVLILTVGGVTIVRLDSKRPLASAYERTISYAVSPSLSGPLKTMVDQLKPNDTLSGFNLIKTGKESLSVRLAMIEAATRSLDLQYYVVDDDVTGKLLLEALLRAADRGVRVRMLIDDLNIKKSDHTWTLLNEHPNLEIRIFNPFATRDEPLFTRISNAFTDLGHFNRRMHNKEMVADNQVMITGGRNLGDAYFDANTEFNFHDVDVLGMGQIVAPMSKSFDRYWNGDESFPLAALRKIAPEHEAVIKLRHKLQDHWTKTVQSKDLVIPISLIDELKSGHMQLLWAPAELADDTPAKIDLPEISAHSKPGSKINHIAEETKKEFIIVSPYFVPGEAGAKTLENMVSKGIQVKILTNSLASTDVVATYSGYSHYRQSLVEHGVDMYEMRPIPGTHPRSHHFSSSSVNSLHTKVYIADQRDIILGSFNLDPRSAILNTEMALVIHSPPLARQLIAMFEEAIDPSSSFHLVIHNNRLEWVASNEGKEIYYYRNPDSGIWRSLKDNVFYMLPFENEL